MEPAGSLKNSFNSFPSCQPRGGHIYLTTNEVDQPKTLTTLSKHPLNGRAAVGVAGFFTLNAVARRALNSQGLDTIILIDRSKGMEYFWSMMEQAIVTSDTRHKVIEKVEKFMRANAENDEVYFEHGDANDALRLLHKEIDAGLSWLSNDDNFARIKKIFDNGHFVFKRMELCDPASFEALRGVLDKHAITVDFIYLSNCYEYLEDSTEKADFISSMEKIIQASTFVIQTRPRACKYCFPPMVQYVQRKNTSSVAALFPDAPPATFHLKGIIHPPPQKPMTFEIKSTIHL